MGIGVGKAAARLGMFRVIADFLLAPAGRAVGNAPRAGLRLTRRSLRAGLSELSRARSYAVRTLTKDPIDVASGEVALRQVDVELAGALPLVVERTHLSSYRFGRWFGTSWASTLDQRLEVDDQGVCFASADGMVLAYPVPAVGVPVLPDAGPRWPLERTVDGGYTITDPQAGRVWHFAPRPEAVLPLTKVSDRNGHQIEYIYRDGLPVEVRHSGGYRIAVETAHDRIVALRLITGEADECVLVRYGYDDAGHLANVINSSGKPLRFTYDRAGRLTSWEDRNGFWYRYFYDEQGRGVRAEGSGGLLNVSVSYAADRSYTTVTDSLGHTTTFHFSRSRQVVAEVDPLGRRTEFEWDPHDRLLARTDALGRTTRYAYDPDGNLVTIVRPDGRRLSARYNNLNLPVEFVEADGSIWRQDFDDRGNLIAITDPRDAVTRYVHDESGHLTTITDALGFTTRMSTDRAGLPLVITDPNGTTTRYDRDAFGRVTAITDSAGGVTRFGWTVEGRPAWRKLPSGAMERWRYDAEGNRIEHVDAIGRVTRTEYGPFDMPIARIGADGARLEFSYDAELRLIAVTNPRGRVWRYEYGMSGDLVSETDFNGRTVSYTHDPVGRLVQRINGAGQITRYTNDLLDNVVEKRTEDTVATFIYDAAGRLIRAVNSDADLRLDRDPLGRIVSETCNGRSLDSGYDLMGRKVWRRTPSGAESVWRYDGGGRPTALHMAHQAIRFEHHPGRWEVQRHIGGRATLVERWNADHRLSTQTLWNASGTGAARPLQHRSYDYRADGAIVGIVDQTGGTRHFELDVASRVTAVRSQRWTETYAYESAGNIISAAYGTDHDASGEREYAGTLVRRVGRTHYTHDRQGRVVQRRRVTLSGKALTWQYTWDADDRLVAVTTPDGQRWRYRYDALGRRVAKQRLTSDGRTVAEQTDFIWDGGVLAEQFQNGYVTTWDYEPETFRPLAQSEGIVSPDASQQWIDRQFYAIVTDLVGTPTEVFDTDGKIVEQFHATLWGSPIGGRQTGTCPLRFPGQYYDAETGLHYNFHRYYDPASGRYQSPDPLGLAPAPDPHTYVPNPILQIDPYGLAPCKPDLHLALGLTYLRGDCSRNILEEFARTVNAHTYFNMPKEWLGGGLSKTIIKVLEHPNTKISFNMTGVDDPYEAFFRVARNNGGRGGGASVTDWELYQISEHPQAWDRITFYKDGWVIKNPFDTGRRRL